MLPRFRALLSILIFAALFTPEAACARVPTAVALNGLSSGAIAAARRRAAIIPAAVTYDTTMGTAVDANGFTTLPLRSGASRYFVKNGGSDSNSCAAAGNPATPLATINAAVACITVYAAAGDQVMLAEGSTFTESVPNLAGKMGFSYAYPTAFRSYDPADPTNESKYGRAYQRNARPVITGTGQIASNVGTPGFLAFQGLDWNPGNVSAQGVSFVGPADGILFEGNLFRYTGLTIDTGINESLGGPSGGLPTNFHVIVRNNALYGGWATTGFAGGLYSAGFNGITVEDNVFYHEGWKIGTSRTRPAGITDADWWAMGGPNVFSHPIYLQTNTTNDIVRRNLIADSSDTATMRGDGLWTENVHIHEPTGSGIGNSSHNENRPLGLNLEASYNLHVGAIDMDSADDRGIAFTTSNGKPGSRIHHNLIVRSQVAGGQNAETFGQYASLPQHSYMEFDHNISLAWNASGKTYFVQTSGSSNIGAYSGYNHVAYDYNKWDDPTGGTNTASGGLTFPNSYTESALLAAAGVTDYSTLISLAITHPEQHYQRTLRALAFTGYGLGTQDTTAPVLSAAAGTTTGASTATIGATTSEGDGLLYYVLTTSSTPPHPTQIKMGLAGDSSPAVKAGSIAVSSTGAKSANLTALSTGTYYAHLTQEDVDGNKSNVVTSPSFTVASLAAVWNDSTGTPASATAWTLSNTNHTATQTANDNTFANLFASQAKATGTVIVTVTAKGTGSAFIGGGAYASLPLSIGLDDGTETTYPGVHNGIGYRCDGVIVFGFSNYATGLAPLNTGDVVKIVKSTTDIKFYVNNALQYTFNGTDYTTSPIAGAAYPTAASLGSSDTAVTIDASGW